MRKRKKELNWYKLQLADKDALQKLIHEFQDIAFHYPFIEGNSIYLDDTASPSSLVCYISLNKQLGLIGEILQLRYSAVQCQRPAGIVLL